VVEKQEKAARLNRRKAQIAGRAVPRIAGRAVLCYSSQDKCAAAGAVIGAPSNA
jgi:hypothetical protein